MSTSYRSLDLNVHQILEGVPLTDVTVTDLPGEGDLTLPEVMDLFRDIMMNPHWLVGLLFKVRWLMGKIFRWGDEVDVYRPSHFVEKIPADVMTRSKAKPGTRFGIFRSLYLLPQECLGEIRNKTVLAFISMVLTRVEGGHRLYWAVYVSSVSWFTPLYMALINPFRRLVVYPLIFRQLRRRWDQSRSDRGARVASVTDK